MLYPIKFKPRVKERIWGGKAILERKGKAVSRLAKDKLYGESWDLSSVKGDISVVANGMLKGNNLEEIIEVYMGELVGEQNFERYGLEFPLLIKYLDCNDRLSVQVHPNDELAEERHQSFGKTEAWYIAECKEGAAIYLGFKDLNITREEYIAAVAESRLESMLNRVEVKKGDCFFIPSGMLHAIGKGCLIAEIQQNSDLTYRVYDYERRDAQGNLRELHTEKALKVIRPFTDEEVDAIRFPTNDRIGVGECLASCKYFNVNRLCVDGEESLNAGESFYSLLCVEGGGEIIHDDKAYGIKKGDSYFLPANSGECKLVGKFTVLISRE